MDKRDSNERKLIDLWVFLGCVVVQQDRNAGFDLVLISPRTGVQIVEVKNEARQWSLTPAEAKRKEEIERIGQRYNVIKTEAEAIALAGFEQVGAELVRAVEKHE